MDAVARCQRKCYALRHRATALVVVLKKLIVVNGTTAGVPLVKGVVICTGGVLDWNKNRSTGNKSLSFLVLAGGCCVVLKFFSLSFLICLLSTAGEACQGRAKRVHRSDSGDP